MHRGDRLRLDRIQHARAPRHGAGVPVLELAPGDEHHRIVVVGALRSRDDVGGNEPRAAALGREMIDEYHGLARVGFALARIRHGAFALETLPADAGDRRHRPAHLLEHFRDAAVRSLVVPVEAEPPRHLLDDPEILARFPGQVQRPAPQLHHAIGIGDGSGLLRPGGGRQDHVGKIGGLGQEDVLHHQPVELGERLAGVVEIRVGHRRVLAHDVHAANPSLVDGIHDLHHGETGLRIEVRDAPEFLELRPDLGAVDALVIRVDHRDETGVGSALDVVLSAQRMQPRAGTTDLSGHERERDQAARVVRAMHVLRHAHAPQDHRRLRGREQPRHLLDGLRRNAAHRRHRLWTVAFDVFLELVVADGAAADEVPIDQTLVDDGVHHRVEERHVGVGIELQHVGRVAGDLGPARIRDDELGAARRRILDPGRGHRMIHGRIRADDEDHLRLHHVHDRIRHGAGADSLEQRRHRRGVAEPRAVIDVVVAEACAHELLKKVRALVAALGRAEARQRTGAEPFPQRLQLPRGQVERFVPGRLAEHVANLFRIHLEVCRLRDPRPPHQRLRKPLPVMHVVEAVAALHAQATMVGRAVLAFDVQDVVVLDEVRELAPDAAVGADRIDDLVRHLQRNAARGRECPGRAGLHALTARDTGAGAHGIVEVEHDLRMVAAPGVADDVVHLQLAAGAHATGALDAGVEVDRHRGMGEIGERPVGAAQSVACRRRASRPSDSARNAA